jgi:hypothetical protein
MLIALPGELYAACVCVITVSPGIEHGSAGCLSSSSAQRVPEPQQTGTYLCEEHCTQQWGGLDQQLPARRDGDTFSTKFQRDLTCMSEQSFAFAI